MRNTLTKLSLMTVACVLAAHGAFAQTSAGDPCSAATSGSCTSGTSSQSITISRPEPLRTSAFVTQIGDANDASISQSSSHQFARVLQNGDNGTVRVDQQGEGIAYLEVDQAGLLNSFVVRQTAEFGGGNIVMAEQDGENNAILLDQFAAAGNLNGAVLTQQGMGNQMELNQAGSDNRAELVQTGDNNAMTATQNGSANQLRWVQDGNGLSDLQIVQSGNQAISITQSNGGI